MIKCPKCKKRGIVKKDMLSASTGDIVMCSLCGEKFMYKKINLLRFTILYIFGFLLFFVYLLWFMFASQYLHDFFTYVSVVVPAIILFKARQAIYLDVKNLGKFGS